ncbi:ELWxxDGT repeat protein [Dyadobacter sp. NIV53]|uniref:ELWxxDGT repeat protein n=1 Tax=Dyadobacter sp. NIV53 TaxID=2861765 RepID=UPI001C870F5A|nr:ELWxxDGT repeat protein [Dyadobacter sp. NIV53]
MLTDIFNDPEVPPTSLRAANGLAFYNVLYNNQIWLFRSDGTKEGTFPLKTTSIAFGENNILAINNSIYFSVISSSGSHQLWKTDGTVAGTVLVKEISNNILGATGAFDFFNFNGTLYFLSGVRYSGQENFQLWKSDGTAGGTVPGPAFGDRFRPVAFNGYMYFSENNVLKRTDGAIITAIKTFTFLDDPIVVGTNIYFSAQDGTTGAELWKSNGTAAGTVLVKDINPGTNISSFPAYLSNANGTLYFSAVTAANNGRELWKSNGTAAGTVLVTDVFSGGDGNVREVTVVGNQVVFTGNNSSGPKLWKSDGTSGGTQVIANFYSTQLVNAGGTVFFSGTETIVTRLYKTNLTPASTIAVSPLTGPGSQPQKMFDLNGTGYFTADNGINGRELWKTDNTNAGTVLVKDILPGSGSSNPDQLTNVNGTLFFVANAQEIWKSNGTSAGTVLVKDVVSVSSDRITGLIALNGTLFFGIATSSQTLQLWKSDGTSAGTVLITTFPNTGNLAAIAFNGQIYFLAWDGVNSYDLWKSNGTAAGTTLVKDVASSGGASGPPVILNNYLYYVLGNYESSGQVLVRSDGTSAGTTVITNLFPGDSGLTISGLFKAGNLLYFNVLGTSAGRELLWRTDGTAAGTIQLGDFDLHYTEDPFIRQKTEAGGKFFFVPYDDEIGDQLWVSDGTPSGTNIVKQIGQFANDFTIDHTAAIGDVIYFTPYDAATGTELWRSDGTSDGTYMVYDLTPNGSTRFYDLADVNGTLLISASAGPLGAELYKYQPAPAALRINSGGASFAASRQPYFYCRPIFQWHDANFQCSRRRYCQHNG